MRTEGEKMKKIVFVLIALIAVTVVIVATPKTQTNADFLRIHIRADSNNPEDQSVKYVVKNAVVDYLSSYLCQAYSKRQAMKIVQEQLHNIKKVCDATLAEKGKTYRANVKLCEEQFPDRCYDGVTLQAGVYDALIIELGSGSGNNWWCVVYPPLCFVEGASNGSSNVVYKSKLLEIIDEWKSKNK